MGENEKIKPSPTGGNGSKKDEDHGKPKKKKRKEDDEFMNDVDWLVNTTNVIEVEEGREKEFWREIVRKIRAKVRKVKRQAKDVPPKFRGYITYPKSYYDKLFRGNGEPKQNLKNWERKIAAIEWEDVRKNMGGNKGIFEVWFSEAERDEFLNDTKGDKNIDSSFRRATGESDGIDEYRDAINSDPDWNPPEE